MYERFLTCQPPKNLSTWRNVLGLWLGLARFLLPASALHSSQATSQRALAHPCGSEAPVFPELADFVTDLDKC